jgi:hypothetical protein
MEVRNAMRPGEVPRKPVPDVVPSQPHSTFTKPTLASKVLVVLLIIVSVLIIGTIGARGLAAATADAPVKEKQYQAVFLTNGQVYFGKLSQVDKGYVKVTDIFYLQVQQQVQPKDAKDQQQPQVSLAKLGSELHGPEDVMYISRDQVLFWENLKNDGKVAEAIKDYKTKK